MFSAIHEYWFSNCFDNLSKQSAAVARPSREQTADKETPKVAEWRNQIKERFVQFAFLKMVMPNGKTMEDCKGREMTKFGAGAAAVGKAIKPNERVGDKLSETEVRKLFR